MAAETNSFSYSFSDFPEDVQITVLSFLTPLEIATFACTSKRFVSLCRSDNGKLWYAICERRWGSRTQIKKWGGGRISCKLLYKTLEKWQHLIGFWRRCGHSIPKQATPPPALIFFEWGPSFISGSRVSPSQNGSYCVAKAPFLWMGISPDGQIVNYLDPDGQISINNKGKLSDEFGFTEVDLVPVNVNFIGNTHFTVEEDLGFAYRTSPGAVAAVKSGVEDNSDDMAAGIEIGSPPRSLPETSEIYRYYANRVSPPTWRRQRRREKERLGKRRWETEHFLKIVDSSPTPDRPLQGLWKGLGDDMKLEFYLVAYDGLGISCRRVGELSEGLAGCTPVFWTSNPTFIDSPFSPEEENIYSSRIHVRPTAVANGTYWECPSMDDEVVSRIMCINSSYDLVIPGLSETAANPWHVEGRIWQYRNGTFGFGFLRDNFIVDLRHIAQDGDLLDTMEL